MTSKSHNMCFESECDQVHGLHFTSCLLGWSPILKAGKTWVGGSMWAQGGIGRGDGDDGEFYISLEIFPEMTLIFLEDTTVH